MSTQQQQIHRADALFALVSNLPGEHFGQGSPLCDDPEASPAERRELAEVFFPVSEHDSARVSAAKAICGRCPVQAACLQYALSHGEDHGVWGGLTEGERREVAVLDRGQRQAGPGEVAA